MEELLFGYVLKNISPLVTVLYLIILLIAFICIFFIFCLFLAILLYACYMIADGKQHKRDDKKI